MELEAVKIHDSFSELFFFFLIKDINYLQWLYDYSIRFAPANCKFFKLLFYVFTKGYFEVSLQNEVISGRNDGLNPELSL